MVRCSHTTNEEADGERLGMAAGVNRKEGFEIGAGDRIRTGDINLGKVALYQLSYSRSL
jgi:hypothetical protein